MKLSLLQLPSQLEKNLLPIYLITGNESLLVDEAKDLIISHARKQEFNEIERIEANKEFDWDRLMVSASALSLFSEKKIQLIQLNHKPTATQSKSFGAYLENIDPSKLIIIKTDKLESASQKSQWVSLIQQQGAIVTIWPMDNRQLKQWTLRQLNQHHLTCDTLALEFLLNQTEGNLLALSQEIQKLALLYQHQSLSLENMVEAIADSAQYDIFQLVDVILLGNTATIRRILRKLREDSIEPTLILWAITREIRSLLNMLLEMKNNTHWPSLFSKYKIWEKRQPLVKAAINQHSARGLHNLLAFSGNIDKKIKGIEIGSVWRDLEILALRLGGLKSVDLLIDPINIRTP